MDQETGTGQDHARNRLRSARDDIRRERAEVMARIGQKLHAWREGSGILQQDLAAEGCVSATVVRRIEKGDYESAPPNSLIAAVARHQGPSGEIQELIEAFRALQARQRRIDKLLARKVVPDSDGWAGGDGDGARLAAELRPAVVPRSPTLFVGRQEELNALARLLDRHRLVTVVGPGGIGKTALCLRFAESRPAPPAGPWFADLSRVRAGEPLIEELARLILDEAGSAGDDGEVVARLGAALAGTPALIILDNCEHVVASAAAAVTRLLSACPGVRVLATSREPLHLPDESVMTVGPLPVADHDRADGHPLSQPGGAVELFTGLLSQARGREIELSSGLLILAGCLIETRRFDEGASCLAEMAAIPGHIDLPTRGDLNVRQGVLHLQRGDPQRAIGLLTEAARCFSIERMILAHGFCLGYLSVAQRRAGDPDTSLRTALEARGIVGSRFGPSCEAEVVVGLAAAYLALGKQEDCLVELDAMPPDDRIRPQTRVHSLVLRAMAASAAAPSAAAAFLLARAGEFAGGPEEQTTLLIRATQEIAFRSAAYEISALLLGVLAGLGPGTQEIEVGLPAFQSSRLQRHLPQARLEELIADASNVDPSTAFGFAVTTLAELAAQTRLPLSPGPAAGTSVTFGTRLMLIAPHSPAPSHLIPERDQSMPRWAYLNSPSMSHPGGEL